MTTWIIVALSRLSTVGGAVVGAEDLAMACLSATNTACCTGIVVLTWATRCGRGVGSQHTSRLAVRP